MLRSDGSHVKKSQNAPKTITTKYQISYSHVALIVVYLACLFLWINYPETKRKEKKIRLNVPDVFSTSFLLLVIFSGFFSGS